MQQETIGIVGAGNIGVGVATDVILHGMPAVVVDLSPQILQEAQTQILNNVRFAPLLNKAAPRVSKERALELLTLTTDLNEVRRCSFVIENVTEDWAIKQTVYQQLGRIAPAGVCFGANTSCISITQIASVTGRAENVVGIHLMNPVHLKSTVEVIRGFLTSQATLDTLTKLLGRLGKRAIVVEDLPGFVSNRISHLFMNEAAFVLQDKVADAAQIDAIFKQCFGHTMGPLETADLIGLDTVVRSLDVLYESYQDSKYRVCPLMRKLVHAGRLGRKAGKGFYDYPEV